MHKSCPEQPEMNEIVQKYTKRPIETTKKRNDFNKLFVKHFTKWIIHIA
jgi:hypothetical protein